MPNYKYQCSECLDLFERWSSIHEDAIEHCDCGAIGIRFYDNVRMIGIGNSGKEYRDVEAKEAQWHKDMPAYARFRQAGFQPPQIDGCDHLEATATNELEIKSGGKLSVPDNIAQESMADAQDIIAGRI